MECLTHDDAMTWRAGVKESLPDGHGRNQKVGDASFYLDEFEPTSVLDVGNRFSPPLECICPPARPKSGADVHRDPSCPQGQACSLHLLEERFQARFSFEQCYDESEDMSHDVVAPWMMDMEHHGLGHELPYMENRGLFPGPDVDIYDDGYTPQELLGAIHDHQLMLPDACRREDMGASGPALMGALEEDDMVNMYINHTGEALASEEFLARSSPRVQSSLTEEGNTCIPIHMPPLMRKKHAHELHFCMDDYLNFDHGGLSASPPTLQMVRSTLLPSIPCTDDRFISDQAEVDMMMERVAVRADDMNSQDDGLQLVHLLLACAEAVAWRDAPLAAALLDRLNVFASYNGDSIQRVTYCFADGLSARLAAMSEDARHMETSPAPTRADRKEGLLQLYQCSPYISFGFFAANEAILQAFEKKTCVHIVDLGMIQNLQWPALIRALATRAEGPPDVRISAFGAGLESLVEMNIWGRELEQFASSVKVPLQFRVMRETLETSKLTRDALGIREGETLAINSVMQLHRVVKESRGSLKGVLQGLHRLGAAVVTLVEQDASHNGPFFLGRFLESLHYYSAIFDSLEASLARDSLQRMKVERLHYAAEIRNIVACEGVERVERHERSDQWRRQMSRAGFQVVPLKFISQARMLLALYSCDGYTLSEEKGCLILGWKGKPIMLASAWKSSSATLSAAAFAASLPASHHRSGYKRHTS